VARSRAAERGGLILRLAAAALVAVAAGCETLPSGSLPDMPDWASRQRVLGGLDAWSVRGRIAIRTGDDASSGSLSWDQAGRDFLVEIDGPLGIGGLRLEGDPDEVAVSGSRIESAVVPDPGREIWRQTGLHVPVEGLRFWLLGVPQPGMPGDTEFGPDGLPSVLRQSGWVIEFREYENTLGSAMPRRIVATSGDTRLTVLIRRWAIGRAG
jgi:outer membrane lipoprotein LolB